MHIRLYFLLFLPSLISDLIVPLKSSFDFLHIRKTVKYFLQENIIYIAHEYT